MKFPWSGCLWSRKKLFVKPANRENYPVSPPKCCAPWWFPPPRPEQRFRIFPLPIEEDDILAKQGVGRRSRNPRFHKSSKRIDGAKPQVKARVPGRVPRLNEVARLNIANPIDATHSKSVTYKSSPSLHARILNTIEPPTGFVPFHPIQTSKQPRESSSRPCRRLRPEGFEGHVASAGH